MKYIKIHYNEIYYNKKNGSVAQVHIRWTQFTSFWTIATIVEDGFRTEEMILLYSISTVYIPSIGTSGYRVQNVAVLQDVTVNNKQ